MVHVIHHNDNDGLVSAAVVARYLQLNNPDMEVFYHKINYNQDLTEMTAAIDSSEGDIYIVDIRLPDNLMAKYASRIIWIDHHESSIDSSSRQSWIQNIKKNYSRVHATDEELKWMDPHNSYSTPDDATGKVRIAGCELTYVSLFGMGEQMPSPVWYTGRYDTWHHKESKLILDFQEGLVDYTRRLSREGKLSNKEIVQRLAAAIFDPETVEQFVKQTLCSGDEIRSKRTFTHAKEAPGMVTKETLCGGKFTVLLVNRGSIGSTFYDSVLVPDAHVLLSFQYKSRSKNWTGNIFTNPKSTADISALSVLKHLATLIKFTSHGGHEGACGFCVEDINDLLKVID